MDGNVHFIRAYRNRILQTLEAASAAERVRIPEGFNNNLVWNLAHVIASQQRICYIMAGLKPVLEESLISPYFAGTKPEASMDEREYANWRSLAMTTLDRLESDLLGNSFDGFVPFRLTNYNLEINSVNDALKMLLFHEGFHFEYCIALRRSLS